MACGLPVLVSSKCGCLPELCVRGVNGFDFDPYNVNDIKNSMLNLASLNKEKLMTMGAESQKIIQSYSPESMALSLSNCLNTLGNKYI